MLTIRTHVCDPSQGNCDWTKTKNDCNFDAMNSK